MEGARSVPSAAGWQPLNRLELAVNDDALTTARILAGRSRGTNAEERLREEVQRLTGDLLMKQAGRDLGFSDEMVQAILKEELERREARAGTTAQLADQLEQENWTAERYVESAQSYIYRSLFVRSVTGQDAGPLGRPYVDRYVRPGRLWVEYSTAPEPPVVVTLRALQFQLARFGDEERARAQAEAALERLDAGEDFAQLAESQRLCEPGTGGILKPIGLEELRKNFPDFAVFGAQASAGDLSEILEWRRDGELLALVVLKLEAKEGGKSGRFEDPLLQRSLRESVQRQLDEVRIDRALDERYRLAYVFPSRTLPSGTVGPPPGR
jgi:hypothetical protein